MHSQGMAQPLHQPPTCTTHVVPLPLHQPPRTAPSFLLITLLSSSGLHLIQYCLPIHLAQIQRYVWWGCRCTPPLLRLDLPCRYKKDNSSEEVLIVQYSVLALYPRSKRSCIFFLNDKLYEL
jgi:hypothetical protein